MLSRNVHASMYVLTEPHEPYAVDLEYTGQSSYYRATSRGRMGQRTRTYPYGERSKRESRSSTKNFARHSSKNPKAPWDMHSLKAAVSAAEIGTGQVAKAICSSTFTPREQAFTKLISVCGRWKQPKKALEVFETMLDFRGVKPNTITYTSLISACSLSGDFDAALDVFLRMKAAARSDPNCQPNEVTYSKIISASDNARKYDYAVHCFSEMEKSGIVADQITFCSALHSCIETGRWETASAIVSKMHEKKCTASVSDYHRMIEHYADNGQWKAALDLFITMQTLEQQVDEHCCDALMKAFEAASIADMAMELLRSMWEEGINVKMSTYVSALKTLATKGQWEQTLETLNTIVQSGHSVPEEAEHFILRTVRCSAGKTVISQLEGFFERLERETNLRPKF